MYNNYKVLPIAPAVFKALAWIGLCIGIISAVVTFVGVSAPETPRWMGLVALIVGAVYFFFFLVASEAVSLLLDINKKIK